MECAEMAGCCPCALAAAAECPYCSLLRGDMLCDCDWQGWCAYERHQWPTATAEPLDGTVVGARPLGNALGLLVKVDERLNAADPGTVVQIRLPEASGRGLGGILLRTYTGGFAYLLLPIRYPHRNLLGTVLELTPDGNAFAGHSALTTDGKTVVLAAEPPLAGLLSPLADGLRRRGNRVAVIAPAEVAAWGEADVVFAAGGENAIKRATTALPPSFRGRMVTWATGGLWPQS